MRNIFKSVVLLVCFLATKTVVVFGQWATYGSNIYNTNSGYVGIGNSTPQVPLSFQPLLGPKISLYGFNNTNYFGFGIQNYQLQIQTDGSASDIVFGYGGGSALTETMRVKGNGNVGIGTSTPQLPLSFQSSVGPKISLWGNSATSYCGFGIQNSQLQIQTNSSGSDIVFGYGPSTSLTEIMRVKGTGNVGIGNSDPQVPLHFQNSFGPKISLYGESATTFYGFGIQNYQLQIQTDGTGSDIVFGSGPTASLTETMRVKGTGNVGIGTSNPTAKLDVKGNIQVEGNQVLELGANISGKDPNAGKIGYETFSPDALDIVGAGISGSRKINFWNEGGASFTGNVGIGNSAPPIPLSFQNGVGPKISLWDNPAGSSNINFYGFGIEDDQSQIQTLQIQTADNSGDILFGYGGSPGTPFAETMRIKGNGEVGIGTSSPKGTLDVASSNGFNEIASTAYGTPSNGIGGGYFIGKRARGTQSAPAPVLKDDGLANFGGKGYGASSFPKNSAAAIIMRAAENWSDNAQGGYMSFFTTPIGQQTANRQEQMRITDAGNVGIGTTLTQNPNNYKLAVNGMIGAQEVQVENTSTTWPDFVFDKNYKLDPLKDIEAYISAHKHLPNVPSEAQVKKEGVKLGNMEAVLLQKVEELTLYVIEQDKRIAALEAENSGLKSRR